MRSPILPRVGRTLAALLRSKSAVAAVEFSMIAPILIFFMLAGVETSRYVNASRAITEVANTEAGLLAARSSMDGVVTQNDITFIQSAAMVIFPRLLSETAGRPGGWQGDLSTTLSSVQFAPSVTGCTANCTYTANVVFSFGTNVRTCGGPQAPAPDSATPTPSTLPTDAFTSGSLVVADIVYKYVPLYGTGIVPTITLHRSAYFQPRYISVVKSYSDCPGY